MIKIKMKKERKEYKISKSSVTILDRVAREGISEKASRKEVRELTRWISGKEHSRDRNSECRSQLRFGLVGAGEDEQEDSRG